MTLSRIFTLAAVFISVTACQPRLTEDNADDVGARRICKKHARCDTDAWRETWNGDRDRCRDDVRDQLDTLFDFGDLIGGELDLDEVGYCLEDIDDADCDDFEEGAWGNDCADVIAF